jgi:hypothetical protein
MKLQVYTCKKKSYLGPQPVYWKKNNEKGLTQYEESYKMRIYEGMQV